ncbi:MAG: VWA domain-containing protein [Caldithrix sp.]|nr:MAG: VWA domain-containing protein [Caldithrix sp.]
MHFLNPSAFYLAALIPIVALLHFLKLRRQRHVVPSVMLWLQAIEDMKANVPFQRLRNSLLLFLQTLFLIIVIATVARPALRQPGFLRGQSVLIIDNSASMQSTELGKSRLDAAKAEALKLIERLHPGGQMMIIDTSHPPRHIRQAFTADKEKLRRAVEKLPAQHTSPELRAIFDSLQLYANTPNTQIFFISDNFEDVPASASHIDKIRVGERGDNVGIVQFSVTHELNEYQVLVGVQNFGNAEKTVQIWLEFEEGNSFDDETIVLAAGETQSLVFPFSDEGIDGQVISARLVEDDLALDNVASAILHPPSKLRVLLVSDRKQTLLTHMLKAIPNVELLQIQTEDYHGLTDRDILIFDQFVPEPLPDGNVIFLNPADGLPFMSAQKNEQPIRVIDQKQVDSVMSGISLIDLRVKESLSVELPIWGISLVETTGAPLIWLGRQGDQKVVVFAFDPFDLRISQFALSIPAAPILMSQCLEWLGSGTDAIQPTVVKVGDPVKIRLDHPDQVDRVTVQLPGGTRLDLVERTSPIIFAETTQIGVYTVFVDEQQFGRFAVNLLNPQASNLSPPQLEQEAVSTARPEIEQKQPDEQEVNREVWGYVAFFALLLLAVEWWVYHRNL